MEEFYPFFLIIFAGVFFSMVFHRIHVPWVVGLIFGGVIVGPHALDVLTITPTLEFIGQVGLVFLMFMAGLETGVSDFRKIHKGLPTLALVNGIIPFCVGIFIAQLFGYNITASLLVGIIFVSSSIAVVIPSLEQNGLLKSKIGQSIVITSVMQDVASLLLLSVVLQSVAPVTPLPLYAFYPLVVVVFVAFKILLPQVNNFFKRGKKDKEDIFQQEFRATFLILLGTVLSFELLGLHPIIAAFFAGVVLSDSLSSEALKDKVRTVSYGIFIPTFFLLIGAKTDVAALSNVSGTLQLTIAIVIGSVGSKFISGWLGSSMVGYKPRQAMLFAMSSIPQLSTTLAVAFAALTLGLVDQKLITAMVALSIVTVVVSPLMMNHHCRHLTPSERK